MHQHASASPSLIDEEDVDEHDGYEHGEEHDHNEEDEVRAFSYNTRALGGMILAAPGPEHSVQKYTCYESLVGEFAYLTGLYVHLSLTSMSGLQS